MESGEREGRAKRSESRINSSISQPSLIFTISKEGSCVIKSSLEESKGLRFNQCVPKRVCVGACACFFIYVANYLLIVLIYLSFTFLIMSVGPTH